MAVLYNLTSKIKEAMKVKDTIALESLRAIKAAVLLQKSEAGSIGELSEEQEIILLQKLIKQRRDSASIFRKQNRIDLAEPEEAQIEIIAQFLPRQMSVEEVSSVVDTVIAQTGATDMKSMGKVMGIVSKKLAGKTDGKVISTLVKERLSI